MMWTDAEEQMQESIMYVTHIMEDRNFIALSHWNTLYYQGRLAHCSKIRWL